MFSYATDKQLNSSQLLVEKSKVQINLEETKSAGRNYCCASFAQGLYENSMMSPLLFASSKIGIQRVYFQRWLVHNRWKYIESIVFALLAHPMVYQKCILSRRIMKYFVASVYCIWRTKNFPVWYVVKSISVPPRIEYTTWILFP